MSARRRLDFSQNWNGKLLNDVFTTIRQYNYEKYEDTAIFEVWLRKTFLGTADIVYKRPMEYKNLGPALLWADTGRDENYARAVFANMYPNIKPDSPMYLLVFKYRQRTKEGIDFLVKDRFEKVTQLSPDLATDLQPTLFKD